MGGVGTLRRYYRAKEDSAAQREDVALMLVWQAKRTETPGTALPETFPLLSRLQEIGYTMIEDLKGPTSPQSADIEELVRRGLSRKEAAVVIAAMGDL